MSSKVQSRPLARPAHARIAWDLKGDWWYGEIERETRWKEGRKEKEKVNVEGSIAFAGLKPLGNAL